MKQRNKQIKNKKKIKELWEITDLMMTFELEKKKKAEGCFA